MNNKEIKLAIDNKEYNKLYKEFTPTINNLVRRYPIDKQDDLKQEGYIALYLFLNKANKYSPRSWKSFIRQFLNSRIIEVARKDTGLIKLPYNIVRLIKSLHKLEEPQTDNELITLLKCKPKELKYAKRYLNVVYKSIETIKDEEFEDEKED